MNVYRPLLYASMLLSACATPPRDTVRPADTFYTLQTYMLDGEPFLASDFGRRIIKDALSDIVYVPGFGEQRKPPTPGEFLDTLLEAAGADRILTNEEAHDAALKLLDRRQRMEQLKKEV